jgi:hypothetical protein
VIVLHFRISSALDFNYGVGEKIAAMLLGCYFILVNEDGPSAKFPSSPLDEVFSCLKFDF